MVFMYQRAQFGLLIKKKVLKGVKGRVSDAVKVTLYGHDLDVFMSFYTGNRAMRTPS